MAYLNCPFCPAQAFPVPTHKDLELGMGLKQLRCISKHISYVELEDLDDTRTASDEGSGD
jgi:hypothetical protein